MTTPGRALLVALAATGLSAGCWWQKDEGEEAIRHYVQGRLAMDRRAYTAALAELTKAVELDRKFASAYAAIGDIHRKQGNHPEAAIAYERACQANPYDFLPHYNLGVTYQLLCAAAKTAEAAGECLSKAVRVYIRAVALKPGDFDANLNLSACYFQQGKYDQAEQYCKNAINLGPRDAGARSNLGVIYDAQSRPLDAIRAYKESLELDVHQPKLLLNMGTTYYHLGWVKDAIHVLKIAAEQDFRSPAPWEQLGACYISQRQWREAGDAYGNAIQRDDRSAVARRGLGVVHVAQFVLDNSRTDLRDKGLEEWHRSLELNPRQPDLLKLVQKYTPTTTAPQL